MRFGKYRTFFMNSWFYPILGDSTLSMSLPFPFCSTVIYYVRCNARYVFNAWKKRDRHRWREPPARALACPRVTRPRKAIRRLWTRTTMNHPRWRHGRRPYCRRPRRILRSWRSASRATSSRRASRSARRPAASWILGGRRRTRRSRYSHRRPTIGARPIDRWHPPCGIGDNPACQSGRRGWTAIRASRSSRRPPAPRTRITRVNHSSNNNVRVASVPQLVCTYASLRLHI